MNGRRYVVPVVRWAAAAVAFAAASYAGYVATTWYRYGQEVRRATGEDQDALLDRFVPVYEVAERHSVRVAAPADITLAAAAEMDLQKSAIVRAIFKGREWIMGSRAPARDREPGDFLSQMRAIGWGELAVVPGREIVMGAVTQPWMADVVFHPVPPGEFAAFHEPGNVKIVWSLRADPIGPEESIFRTETRVATTDPAARARFRRYWSLASPGIILIRWMTLGPLKAEAERRAHAATAGSQNAPLQAAR